MIDISSQWWARFAAIGVLAAALGLSACGRKGPLDPPPGAAAPAPTQSSLDGAPAEPAIGGAAPRQTGGVSAAGKAVAPPPSGRREPFILDWLIQ